MFPAAKAQSVERAGHALKCPVCGHDKFWVKEAQLHTKTATFFRLEWLNPKGDCYICEVCRHIEWFFSITEEP